jgi:HlyD family secretion protein
MRKWTLRLLLPIAIALGFLLRVTVFAPDPVVVKVVRVERAPVEATITNSKAGTIRARRRAKLSAESGGRVVSIAKREGEWVKQDEVILHLNDASARAQQRLAQESLRVAEAAGREACIARDRAKRELERKRSLASQRIVSEDVLDALQSAWEAASASCAAVAAERDKAEAAIVATEAEISKYVIRAPFDGVIAELTAEIGEWITPSPPLLTAPAVVDVIDLSSLYVSAPMDEVDSASIRVDQPVKITVDSHRGRSFEGRVVRVAPYVLDLEAQNRTVEIEVEFDDDAFASSLLPGTSADVEVILEIRRDVLRLPTSALLEGRRVLLPENGELVEHEIEIGLKNWDYAEVTKGLEAGQIVVVSLDREEVKAGAQVEFDTDSAEP